MIANISTKIRQNTQNSSSSLFKKSASSQRKRKTTQKKKQVKKKKFEKKFCFSSWNYIQNRCALNLFIVMQHTVQWQLWGVWSIKMKIFYRRHNHWLVASMIIFICLSFSVRRKFFMLFSNIVTQFFFILCIYAL